MAESKITVARVKDKVGGKEAEVSKLLYSDNGNIKTIGGDSALTYGSAKTLNGETKEQLLANVNAATVGGKSLAQIQSRGKFGPVRLLMEMSSGTAPYLATLIVTDDDDLLFCGYQHSSCTFMVGTPTNNIPWISIPHPLKGVSKIKKVFCNHVAQFLLYENGDLYARGNGDYYNLGIGNNTNQYNWVKVTDNVKKFIPGPSGEQNNRSNNAVLKNDGSVWFWGENYYGHAGMGNTTALQVPTKLALTFLQAGDSVKDVVLSDSYYTSAYIITEKGKLYSCGCNDDGQLGLNDTTNRSTFAQVTELQDKTVESLTVTTSITSSSSIYYYTNVVAKTKEGYYYAWGAAVAWKFNGGTASTSNKPVIVDNSSFPAGVNILTDPIIDMRAFGYGSVYALTRSGRLFGAGYNSFGQLGDGTTADKPKFVEMKINGEPNAKFKQFWYTMCGNQPQYGAITAKVEINGKHYLYGCGINGYGTLGINSGTANITILTRILFDSDKVEQIKQFESGGYQNTGITMILLNNGQYWACGYNNYGAVMGNGVGLTPITYPMLVL